MMIQVLETRINRFIKRNFPDGDTQAIVCALRDILQLTDRGRAYRRQILACYSKTKQAQILPEFQVACENLLVQYQRKPQLSLFGGGAA
jgi:hypothetical protein